MSTDAPLLPSALPFSKEQEKAWNLLREGKNVFITGPGGTGKTFFIQKLYAQWITENKIVAVCALTGCAAILLQCEGSTIHSWAGIGLAKDAFPEILKKIKKNQECKRRWKTTDVLIVDEVSMMSTTVLELLDKTGRALRQDDRPFGGIQVLFSGDFFQLPPFQGEKFCFESPLWNHLFPRSCCISFSTIFRQKDADFQRILNEVRRGHLGKTSESILNSYLHRQNVVDPCVKIFPLRKKVEKMNQKLFDQIPEAEVSYPLYENLRATHYVHSNTPIPEHKYNKVVQKVLKYEAQKLLRENNCEATLKLKKGCHVMCLTNLDMEQGICNGAQGIVVDTESAPKVRFQNGVEIKIPLQYFQSKEHPQVVIAQYPLCLAWAITIHKIQGTSLDAVEMDIGSEIFEYGQSYVALSRLKSLEGLYLRAFSKTSIRAHPKVSRFYQELESEQEEKV